MDILFRFWIFSLLPFRSICFTTFQCNWSQMIETFHSKRFQWLCDFRFEIDPSDWWTAVAAFLSYYNFKFYKFALKLCYNFASDLFTFLPIRTNRLAAFHIAISIVAAGEQAELWFLVPVLLHSWHGFRAQIASACRSSVTEVQSAALQRCSSRLCAPQEPDYAAYYLHLNINAFNPISLAISRRRSARLCHRTPVGYQW